MPSTVNPDFHTKSDRALQNGSNPRTGRSLAYPHNHDLHQLLSYQQLLLIITIALLHINCFSTIVLYCMFV